MQQENDILRHLIPCSLNRTRCFEPLLVNTLLTQVVVLLFLSSESSCVPKPDAQLKANHIPGSCARYLAWLSATPSSFEGMLRKPITIATLSDWNFLLIDQDSLAIRDGPTQQ